MQYVDCDIKKYELMQIIDYKACAYRHKFCPYMSDKLVYREPCWFCHDRTWNDKLKDHFEFFSKILKCILEAKMLDHMPDELKLFKFNFKVKSFQQNSFILLECIAQLTGLWIIDWLAKIYRPPNWTELTSILYDWL